MIKYDENTIIPIWHVALEIFSFLPQQGLESPVWRSYPGWCGNSSNDESWKCVAPSQESKSGWEIFFGGVGEQKSKQNKQVGYGKYRNMYILSIYVYRERERKHMDLVRVRGYGTSIMFRSQLVQNFIPPSLNRWIRSLIQSPVPGRISLTFIYWLLVDLHSSHHIS